MLIGGTEVGRRLRPRSRSWRRYPVADENRRTVRGRRRSGSREDRGAPGATAGGLRGGSRRIIAICMSPSPARLAQPANASGSLTALDIKTGVARWHMPSPEPACAVGSTQLLACAIPGSLGHAGQRVFRIDGWALARLLDHRRQDLLGLRHGQGLSNARTASRQAAARWIMAARPS